VVLIAGFLLLSIGILDNIREREPIRLGLDPHSEQADADLEDL